MKESSQQMPKRWPKLKRLLEKNGWTLRRITGSHHIFTKPNHSCVPVAFHGGKITKLHASLVLKQAKLLRDKDAPELLDHMDDQDPFSDLMEKDLSHQKNHDIASLDAHQVDISDQSEENLKQKKKRQTIHNPTLADIEAIKRKEKEYEFSTQEYHRMNEEEAQLQEQLRKERSIRLEKIQILLSSNDYQGVLDMTSSINIHRDDLGSSSELYEYNSTILFYRTISMAEYALSLEFNSEEQQKKIYEALDSCRLLMESSPEQRKEFGEVALNLQERVIAMYLHIATTMWCEYQSKMEEFDNSYYREWLPELNKNLPENSEDDSYHNKFRNKYWRTIETLQSSLDYTYDEEMKILSGSNCKEITTVEKRQEMLDIIHSKQNEVKKC